MSLTQNDIQQKIAAGKNSITKTRGMALKLPYFREQQRVEKGKRERMPSLVVSRHFLCGRTFLSPSHFFIHGKLLQLFERCVWIMMARNMPIELSQCHVPWYINMQKRKRKEEHHWEQDQKGISTPYANGFDVRVHKLVTRLGREPMAHGRVPPKKRENAGKATINEPQKLRPFPSFQSIKLFQDSLDPFPRTSPTVT